MLKSGKRKGLLTALVLCLVLLVLSLVSLSMGSVRIPFTEVIMAVIGHNGESSGVVVVEFRLPRVVAAILIGAAMAVSGALFQGVIRNPLAAPDLLGVAGGASVAVVAFMTLSAGAYSIHWVPVIAIVGAFAAAALNYMLAWKKGVSPFRLVLIGIGISTAMGALTTFILISGPAYLASQVLNWITGSIYGTNWKYIAALFPWVAVFLPLAFLFAKELNVQSLGEDVAVGLGSRLQLNRFMLLAISVSLAGAAVGVAGTISFIGLLAPHMARKLAGNSYKILLPISALLGAIIVLLADLAGRMLFQPLDIPAGVFTAGIGAPFFMYLLYKRR
ncbi:FecCD family ABC transporter permease [Paenibacillus validus]|uniref:Iron chelate uptake ABC transporter family permease subunit n=1 Tax=Paenibacillus validus TaxID=44253 RepID=A0A7X3CUH0_9BACL|nr:iron ABC transporter permease [Paenibacillus validus]MUG72701.1 iron chelate uptake ABC transporter family permease subunit [Paenibacillus validus]